MSISNKKGGLFDPEYPVFLNKKGGYFYLRIGGLFKPVRAPELLEA